MSDVPNRPNPHKRRNSPNIPNVSNRPIQHTNSNRNAKSTVTKAHPTGPSLRTTIPRRITEILDWNSGDVLSWEIEKRGERYFVVVRRLE